MKKTFIFMLALVIALGVSLVATMPVAADPGMTYYVSNSGSDVTGTGAWDNPWATIQHAVDQVSSGDTIQVASGTYAGAIVDKDTTISGSTSGTSTINTGVAYKAGSGLTTAFRLDEGADGAEIKNFTVNCNQSAGFYFAVFSRGADDVTIDGLEVNDTVQGITNWGGSGWTITNNVVTDTVAAGGGGIAIFLGATPPSYRICSDNLVQYNTIDASATAEDYSCPGICVALDLRYGAYASLNGTEDVSANQILNNNVTASGANNGIGVEVGVIGLDGDPDKIDAIMTTAPVHDNTVQENGIDGADTGIYFYNATNLTITQNTVQNSVSYGIYADDGQSGTVITDNTFTNNEIQLADETDDTETLDPLDIESILSNNTFDRAVTVDHPGASLLHTIWSHIQDAVDAASAGDTINVAAGTYVPTAQVLIDKDLTIIGEDKETTIIEPASGFTDSYLFRINDGQVSLSDVTLDGKGNLYGGVRYTSPGTGTVEDCTFKNITYGTYLGIGLVLYGDNVTVSDNIFNNIGRVGIWAGGDNALVTGNTYTGKGAIDCIDYGIEVGFGGVATISGNTITNCRGVASSDNSTSAAILVTTYYGTGTTATITGNTLTGNTGGIAVGYDEYDTSTVIAHYNDISGNTDYGIDTTAPSVDATANWWGDASGPYNANTNPSGTGNDVSDNVDYSPWWGANYVGVSHPWEWYTNDSIQEAIDAASAGDTINVMAGTYVEDLVIPAGKDGLDLKGTGCNLTTIKGVATADQSDPPVYNIRFDEFVGVNGVKIHGFTIESPDVPTNHFASGMVLNGQDIEIYDNCFVSKGAEGAEDNYCVAIQTWRWSAAPDSDLTGLKVYNNTFSSEGDLWVYQGVFVNRDGEDFGDITVSDNSFSGNIHMGIAYEGNNAVISGNEMTSTYEGTGIAIMDWAELEQDDIDVDGNELQGFNYGVLVGRGAQVMTNITVANNLFSDNRYQVRDRVDTLNMEDVLAGNTFDRAVVVRGSGIKVPTIFSSIQDAIDAAVAGDTVEVMAGTYDEQVTIDKSLNLVGSGEDQTFVKAAGSPVITVSADDVTIQELEITDDTQLVEAIRVVSGASTGLTVDHVDFTELGAGTGANAYGIYIANSFANLSVTDCDFVPVTHTTYHRTMGIFAPNHLNLSDFEVSGSTFEKIWTGIYLRSAIDGLGVTGCTFGQVDSWDFKACVAGIYIGDGSDYNFDIENVVVSDNTFTEYGRGVYVWNYANNETVNNFEIYGNNFTNSVWSSGIRFIGGIGEDEGVAFDGINVHDNIFAQDSDVGGHVALIDFRAYCELADCDIAVTDNEITLSGGPYTDPWTGIVFSAYAGPFTNTVVDGNTLNGGNCGGAGTPPSTGVLLKHESSTYWPSGILEIDITNNQITGFDHGVGIYDNVAAQYGGLPTGCDVDINYNKIHGNTLYGVINGNSETVDATANWWGAASGPYHDALNLGGEGDTVSDNVLFEPWYGDEGLTTLVGHSTYEFVYDVPDVVVACEETEIPVTFQTDELGAAGYYGVRFKFDATGPGDVIFKATDSEEVEHTFVNSGFWGPSDGYNLTADYSDTTDWSLNFSEPGEYDITFSLIEAPDGDIVAGIEDSEDITVRAVDILDHYRHLHEPFDEVTTLDLLAAADDWIANEVPPGFDEPITTMQLLALADEWFSS